MTYIQCVLEISRKLRQFHSHAQVTKWNKRYIAKKGGIKDLLRLSTVLGCGKPITEPS